MPEVVPTSRVQRPGNSAPSSGVLTPRSLTSTGAKATPVPSVYPDPSTPLGLFQSACELDPISQSKLLNAVATSCVAKHEKLIPSLWTAVKVHCCQSKVFLGYICGASDSDGRTIVLCSVPEGKVTFVSGWSIEKIEILSNYPPLPEEMKAKLDSVYFSSIDDEPVYSTECNGTDSLDRRRQSVLSLFGPLVAKTSEEDEKIVLYDGLVTVMPPYLPSSCRSSNPTLLKRIQEMLMQIDERPL
ncbi:unnamed protein product [Rodentolepis nana]|uniref:Gemin6_C domain-containing protein n=1 Tax=Rodentolepis nana TaxID=102285 RepID=A0A0R3TFX4_RODNA|nr:unnamed protein product [Rodentolepis nana]